MTKKRYIRNIVGQVYDFENDKWYHEEFEGKPLEYEDDVIKLLNGQDKKIKELTEEKNYFKRAYHEFIDFADKKAKELGYPSFCTDVINEIITQKEME